MTNHIPKRLWRLMDSALDGSIAAEEMCVLERAIREDPQVARTYQRYCQLHIDLTIDARAEDAFQRFRQIENARDACVNELLQVSSLAPATRWTRRRVLRNPWTVSAAALSLVAACAWFFLSEGFLRSPANQGLAVVTAVTVESGAAKIEIEGVGSVLVEDRSSFEILGPMRARLTKGRIEMHVDRETGRGFVVETPYGEVTDLGTKFGVDVDQGSAGVVVFQGKVDLKVPQNTTARQAANVHHLTGGEGLVFDEKGEINRMMAITTGVTPTFSRSSASAELNRDEYASVIANVTDNLRTDQTRMFYEIVPGGFKDDCLAYVDRPEHDWSGDDESGIPDFLRGADYVKTFNDDKNQETIELTVAIRKPATLYLFLDDRVEVPPWLARDWKKTESKIGLDLGFHVGGERNERSFEPGVFEERFSIWKREIDSPGPVLLGPNGRRRNQSARESHTAMYVIAAAAKETETPANEGNEFTPSLEDPPRAK